MYIDEIRALSTDEILDKIEDLKVEIVHLSHPERIWRAERYNPVPQDSA